MITTSLILPNQIEVEIDYYDQSVELWFSSDLNRDDEGNKNYRYVSFSLQQDHCELLASSIAMLQQQSHRGDNFNNQIVFAVEQYLADEGRVK